MRVLITSAGRELPMAIAAALAQRYDVRLTDRTDISTDGEFVQSDLGHDESTNDLVRGMDAIVHSGEVDLSASASEQLDYQTRCTYNLLRATVEEGVSRFIYLSSLSIIERYEPDLVVTERWRPVPSTDSPVLCYHLGEYVCREFAREGSITVVCLRLGKLVTGGNISEPTALHIDDAAHAVERALITELRSSQTARARPGPPVRWGAFHIQSPVPNARFMTTTAERALEYNPTFRGQVQR